MTWPLAAVIIVAIVALTVALVAPLVVINRLDDRGDKLGGGQPPRLAAGSADAAPEVHHLDLENEETRIEWPKREEGNDP